MPFAFYRIFLIFVLSFTSVFCKSVSPLELPSLTLKKTEKTFSLTHSTGPVIILDPGHGGSDTGAEVRKLREKKITLLAALYTKKKLEELGYHVVLTRKKDAYLSLPKRVSLANRLRGTLFVSIHCNAASNPLAQGLEIYYHSCENKEKAFASKSLADRLLKTIITETGCSSRGVKSGRFYVIRETVMPSVLVEIGFLTNYEEWASMRKKSYLEKMASGIASGVDAHLKAQKHVLGAS